MRIRLFLVGTTLIVLAPTTFAQDFDWRLADPRGKLLAWRAAQVDAYRQMDETILELRLDADTTVRDFAKASAEARKRVEAVLSGHVRIPGPGNYRPDGTVVAYAELDRETLSRELEAVAEDLDLGGKWSPETFAVLRLSRDRTIRAIGVGCHPEAPRETPSPAGDRESPLSPLLGLCHRLDEGVAGFLQGRSLQAGLPEWEIGNAADAGNLRQVLKGAGAASVSSMVLGVEFLFDSESSGPFHLKTAVCTLGGPPTILAVGGPASPDRERPAGWHGPKSLTGPGRPFGDAATALLEAVKESAPSSIFPTDPAELWRLLGPVEAGKEMEGFARSSRTTWPDAWREIRALRPDRVSVRAGSLSLLVRDRAGGTVGLLTGRLDLGPDGALGLHLESLRKIRE